MLTPTPCPFPWTLARDPCEGWTRFAMILRFLNTCRAHNFLHGTVMLPEIEHTRLKASAEVHSPTT